MNAKSTDSQSHADNKVVKSSATIVKLPRKQVSAYTEELAEEICTTIATSITALETLCSENPHWPTERTIYKWLSRNQEFHGNYIRAKEFQAELLVDRLLDLINSDYLSKYIDELGNVRIDPVYAELMRLKFEIIKFLAAKFSPHKYG